MKFLKRVLIGLLVVSFFITSGFVIWAVNPLNASPEALSALESDSQVKVLLEDGFISFLPANDEAEMGFVFYPGGRVDYRAYAVPLRQIAAQGYQVVLIHAPLNLAFFDVDAATQVITSYPNIKNWVVGGHSLGGSMAASFASAQDNVRGLILWASYPGDDALMNKNIRVLSIYGTLDMAGIDTFDEKIALLPSNAEYVIIQGGNHAQFGDYGFQPGDNEATISRAGQQQQAVDATVKFLESLTK